MEKRRIDTFEGAVEYLYNMPRFTTKNTMEDTVAQLVRLGSPDRKIRHIIHVAGTNGKGSVCTYLRYCLQEAGYHVGVFTSPHLVDIRERFAVDGTLIDEEDFLRFFQEVYDSLDWEALQRGEGYHPTFFEYLFFMCMLYFAEKQPDYCILETGLGGRLDATNAVSHKELAVITRISLDHVEYLGDTVAQIAAEKAGIMKEGVPVVYCAEVPEAEKVFVKTARNMQARAVPVSKKDYMFHKFHNKTIDFSLRTRYYGYIGVSLHTIAHYQMENAALAVRALEALGEQEKEIPCLITGEQIRRGLEKAFWPGRMEEILPELYVDGAHNADGIRAFLDTVKADGCSESGQTRHLIFSVVQDKDYKNMIKQVADAGLFARIYVAHMHTARAAGLETLKRDWMESAGEDTELIFCGNVQEALRRARAEQNGARIYVAGSLYLVGEIKEFFKNDKF